ncbi:MAG: hypothetical protein RR766_00065 [Longicatena sp.]|uniref:hypothetical protein n=1 Tax=Anaerorhabdus sp. TaxID=1872524 RepID=UPI002FC6B6F9
MDVKVTVFIEAGQSLINLVSMLTGNKTDVGKTTGIANEEKKFDVPTIKSKNEPKLETPIGSEEDKAQEIKTGFTVTKEVLRALCSKQRNEGKDITTVFEKFGVKKLSEIEEKDFEKVYAEIELL